MEDEGLEIVRSARKRHDGHRRSPWNEIECGSYYARSMSAFAALNAWSGLRFDMVKGSIGVCHTGGQTQTFWATGTGWGTITVGENSVQLVVLHGSLNAEKLEILETNSFTKSGIREGCGIVVFELSEQTVTQITEQGLPFFGRALN